MTTLRGALLHGKSNDRRFPLDGWTLTFAEGTVASRHGFRRDSSASCCRARCARFSEGRYHLQRHHSDPQPRKTLSRIDRYLSRSVPRPRDRQNRRDRRAWISLWIGG